MPSPRTSQSSRASTSTTSLFSLTFLALLLTPLALASAAPARQSPSADSHGDLICHTSDPAECYPRIFIATHEFQVVRDDQDLPPGLHVQLDMQTGRKQAKIIDPEEAPNPALEGLPVEHAVVLVDQDPESPEAKAAAAAAAIPAGAPAYDPNGAIKEPREKHSGFAHSLSVVKDHILLPEGVEQAGVLVPALADLEELSHDMYYGLKIAEDGDVVRALFCILLERDVDAYRTVMEQHHPSGAEGSSGSLMEERPDFLASSVLASAIRNNPASLAALEKAWFRAGVVDKGCRLQPISLKEALYDNLAPSSSSSPSSPSSSSLSTQQSRFESDQTRLTLAVLRGLLKSPSIRDEFLARGGGMQQFLQILLTSDEAWVARKDKVARIVADTFLDEDAGAVVGVWPKAGSVAAREEECAAGDETDFDGGSCWEYQLGKIIRDGRGGTWAEDLLTSLEAIRPQVSGQAKQEL